MSRAMGSYILDSLRAAPRSTASTRQGAGTVPGVQPGFAPGQAAAGPAPAPAIREGTGATERTYAQPGTQAPMFPGMQSSTQAAQDAQRAGVNTAMNSSAATATPPPLQTNLTNPPAPAAPLAPLFANSAYTVAPAPFVGDPTSWLQSHNLPTDRGVPVRVTLPDGRTGYIVQRGADGLGKFVDPAQAFSSPRNAFDEAFVNQIRSETKERSFLGLDKGRDTLKNNINSWLDNHPAGVPIDQAAATEFESLLNELSPNAAQTFREVVSAGGGTLKGGEGYNLYSDAELPTVLKNLGLDNFTPVLGLPQDVLDSAAAGGGSSAGDLSTLDYGQLIKDLTSSEQSMLLQMGLGGILGGNYSSNQGMSSDLMAAILGAVGQRKDSANILQPTPMNQQPGLTSVPLY